MNILFLFCFINIKKVSIKKNLIYIIKITTKYLNLINYKKNTKILHYIKLNYINFTIFTSELISIPPLLIYTAIYHTYKFFKILSHISSTFHILLIDFIPFSILCIHCNYPGIKFLFVRKNNYFLNQNTPSICNICILSCTYKDLLHLQFFKSNKSIIFNLMSYFFYIKKIIFIVIVIGYFVFILFFKKRIFFFLR